MGISPTLLDDHDGRRLTMTPVKLGLRLAESTLRKLGMALASRWGIASSLVDRTSVSVRVDLFELYFRSIFELIERTPYDDISEVTVLYKIVRDALIDLESIGEFVVVSRVGEDGELYEIVRLDRSGNTTYEPVEDAGIGYELGQIIPLREWISR